MSEAIQSKYQQVQKLHDFAIITMLQHEYIWMIYRVYDTIQWEWIWFIRPQLTATASTDYSPSSIVPRLLVIVLG